MVKVASDPAQVIVNHASFRVQLPSTSQPRSSRVVRRPVGAADRSEQQPRRAPVVGGASSGAARRRAPVVWSGRSEPGDTAATGLLQAVRATGVRHGEDGGRAALAGAGLAGSGLGGPGEGLDEAAATQAIPVLEADEARPFGSSAPGLVETQALAEAGLSTGRTPAVTPLLPQMRSSGSAFEEDGVPYGRGGAGLDEESTGELDRVGSLPNRGGAATRRADAVRHAYYPGRRMNLGVVLLPLRVFLGLISVYAGMGKLCDPVYFDGGERGSMVKWLTSLHPWALAEPLRDFALQHPVGSGLTIAFLQVVAGVLTVFGLWQRLAAGLGALLSAALLVTVSWKTVPAYDAPDFIYLAAWSPLIIAGAPVYSVDGRLASEAWRKLGPRASLAALRGRVLRRGTVLATVLVGLTLLVGSLLGGAVRDAGRVTAPGPGEAPRNELPGSPFPQEPGTSRSPKSERSPASSGAPTQGQEGRDSSAPPSAGASTPARTGGTQPGASSTGTAQEQPSQTQGGTTPGSGGAERPAAPQQQAPQQQAPSSGGGPTSTGGGSTGSVAEEPGQGGGADQEPESGGSLGGLFG